MNKRIYLFLFIISIASAWYGLLFLEEKREAEYISIIKEVSNRLLNEQAYEVFLFEGKNVEVQFNFNSQLEDYIKKQMRMFASIGMTVVVIDNDTGRVLSLLSYDKEKKEFGRSMAILASHPSASLSKIVSAADLIENAGYYPWTNIITRGKGTTLYKYQLKKEHRWNRKISLEKAFAYSNNAAFGKAVIHNSTASSLYGMAMNFGFNRSLTKYLKLPKSIFRMPKDQYNLAELASGFNTETMISPLHAAVFASIVANEGMFVRPKLLKSIKYNGEELITSDHGHIKDTEERVISFDAASQLAQLMVKTVEIGTAKKSFRRFNKDLKEKLEIGGKTGSITGGVPEGKRDWFSAYSKPKNSKNKGISISVMSIQGAKWRAKSSYLAKNIIEYYYRQIENQDDLERRVFANK